MEQDDKAASALRVLDLPDGWPTPDGLLQTDRLVEDWFAYIARQWGAGVFADDEPGVWATERARLFFDRRRHGPNAVRCPVDMVAHPGGSSRYCSARCRRLRARPGWEEKVAWVVCACGTGHLATAYRTSRPQPACPPLPGESSPSACERAYRRVCATRRMARHRARRVSLVATPADLVSMLTDWDPLGIRRRPAGNAGITSAFRAGRD